MTRAKRASSFLSSQEPVGPVFLALGLALGAAFDVWAQPAAPVEKERSREFRAPAERVAKVSDDFSARLRGGEITVTASPIEGENPIEFARRIARDETAARTVFSLPGGARRRSVTLSYGALSPEAKLSAIRALFPSDLRATAGWIHIAVADEALTSIAEWFSGDAALGAGIARHNKFTAPIVPRGAVAVIPTELLLPAFQGVEPVEDHGPPSLEFDEDAKGRFAIYRLRRGEALYSAVVVRFTGRVHAEDVVTLALKLAERSGIEDVHAIPVGYPIKIPLEYLADEFLPPEDPRAQALRRERAEASQFGGRERASGLSGVRVVIDAGHGGRDTGTLHAGVWESTYVYDVACRLHALLTQRTKAEAIMTSEDPRLRLRVPDRDRLKNSNERRLLTDPPHPLVDPIVGVNLRWYLANSLLKRPNASGRRVPPERTVYISIHADSLHSSVRGAMVYVPGERFLRDRYGKRGEAYERYREYREAPTVSFNKKERVASEGVSTVLAEKIIGAIRAAGLPVHQFSPVRTHVIRGGGEWVPAVLRYNRIPARVLVEMSNLGNDEDRALTLTRAFRQRVAEALLGSLMSFFGAELERPDRSSARGAAPSVAETPSAGFYGPDSPPRAAKTPVKIPGKTPTRTPRRRNRRSL